MSEILIIYKKAKRNYIVYKGILQYGPSFSLITIIIEFLHKGDIYYSGLTLVLYMIVLAIVFGVMFSLSIFSLFYNKNKVLNIAKLVKNNIDLEEPSVIFIISIFLLKNRDIKENFDTDYFYSELYSICHHLKVSNKSIFKIEIPKIRQLISRLNSR